MLVARLILWPTLLGAAFGLIGLILSWPSWICLLLFAPLITILVVVGLLFAAWGRGGWH